MKGSQAVYLVARREFWERVREKSFLIGMGVTMAVILAVILVPPLIFGEDGPRTVGLVGESSAPYADALVAIGPQVDLEIETTTLASADAARVAVEEGEVEAAVVDGEALLTEAGPGDELTGAVQAVAQQIQAVDRLAEAGVPADEAVSLLTPTPLEIRSPTGADADADDPAAGVSFLVSLVLYGQLLTVGSLVATGVVEEKATRVVEILLATIRPGHLLAGKIIGIGLVGLTQLVLMAAAGLAAVLVTGLVEIPDGAYTAIGLGFLWFLLGFAFFSCAYASLASLVSRQEEVQNTTMPVTLLVIGGFFVSFAAAEDPGSTIVRVASFFPPFAPLVMPARGGAVALPEAALAIAVSLAASALLVVIAGKIYAGAVLRTGSKVKLRQALRGS